MTTQIPTTENHKWEWCDHCQVWTIICGRCGNNVCNAGSGEEIGPEPGTMIPCRLCDDAYNTWINYKGDVHDEHTNPKEQT